MHIQNPESGAWGDYTVDQQQRFPLAGKEFIVQFAEFLLGEATSQAVVTFLLRSSSSEACV